jgi:CheY-like chemotaxis protein/nitrogen-specific signal transduction histidine kinase
MRRVKSAKAAKGKRRKVARSRRAARSRQASARIDATEIALAGLAHEIRTPLNGILALSELIAAADLPARERGWAMSVRDAAEHLAQLSTLVVDGVRANARGLVLQSEPFRLRALVASVGATLAARAQAKQLAAELRIADDVPELVAGDRVRLRAALENLADNAVKFTERGGVTLNIEAAKATRGRHRVVFSFTDTGAGLAKAEIARLFRPFAQASAGVARRYGGAGLGLVFVKRIAEAMDGTLAVQSRGGTGSTFRLTVMLAAAASAASTGAGEAARAHSAEGRSLHVLCAEDNPYARVVLNTILTELGHRADFAGTGEAAVAAVKRGGYDVVLMDVTLPGLDGLGAVRAIRALPNGGAGIRIIGVSGRSDRGDREAAIAAGMDDFLAKPVSPTALAQALIAHAPGS